MDQSIRISICVPTWNRTDLVIRAIEQVIDDPRVGEIIILDDDSNWQYYAMVCEKLAALDKNEKVFLWRNEFNLDCYKNKAEVLRMATNEWCILLDSDNVIDTSYIDAIYALPEWHSAYFYAPEFAKPHFDYRMFSGQTINHKNVHSHCGTKEFDCLINTANYFVNRDVYLYLFNPDIDPHAADTIYMNSRLFDYGGSLYVVPCMQYFHDVHPGSHYKANNHKSNGLFEELKKKLEDMR